MKKYLINPIIIIVCAGGANVFTKFMLNLCFGATLEVFSIADIILCAIVPIILLLFDKKLTTKKLVIVSVLYSLLFSFAHYYKDVFLA